MVPYSVFMVGTHVLRRAFYRAVAPIRKFYWFLFRPRTRGVKCLIKQDGSVLMVRNTYGKMHWTFPGGRINRRESPENAVSREVKEEVGITIVNPRYLGEYRSRRYYKGDTVHCYLAEVTGPRFTIDAIEIQEAAWFPAGYLPYPRSFAVTEVLDFYNKALAQKTNGSQTQAFLLA